MKKDATTGRTSYTEVETKADGTTPNLHTMKDADSNANGPKGFFEAAWVFRKGDTYYNVYDGGKPGSGTATCVESNYQACIQYSTSDSPLGPWNVPRRNRAFLARPPRCTPRCSSSATNGM